MLRPLFQVDFSVFLFLQTISPDSTFHRKMRTLSTKNRRHRHQVKVLKSEIMSPRIAWFNFLSFLKLLTKIAIWLGILLALAYGVREAIQYTFHQNPDFKLQAIRINENDVIDETGIVEHLGIDLESNIFDLNLQEMSGKLTEIPAIAEARVERELPGTLDFKITTRKPQGWISCTDAGLTTTRTTGELLIDETGFIYPCPEQQLDEAVDLPILHLKLDPEHPIRAGVHLQHPEYRRCSQLLRAFRDNFPDDIKIIDSFHQSNPWSIELTTRTGTIATFGLDDHRRQLDYFNQALQHAQRKGYEIATIQLIPKQNVPITIRGEEAPPRAIPVSDDSAKNPEESRRKNDLQSLLNRN